MKKLLLLTIGAGLSFGAFAQSAAISMSKAVATHKESSSRSVNKTSAHYDDSLLMDNGVFFSTDTPYTYLIGSTSDSGYFFGESLVGLNGFAQRYDFNTSDSSIEVLGVISLFGGAVSPTSSNHVVLKAWSMGSPEVAGTHTYSGFPSSVLDSIIVPFTGLNVSDTALTYTVSYFATPTAYLLSSFFVGYTTNYTWGSTAGDTLSLLATDIRNQSIDTIVAGDTIVNDQNASFDPGSGQWLDNGFDFGLATELFIFPIVTTHVTEGFKGITKNNLTFYGNYPNPAVNNTNIKISLANPTDVTITITDAAGRTVNTINQTNLSAGTHIIPVSTANMPAGDYIYLVRTAAGDGMASKLTVIK